jgi:hypothetical protein
MSSREENNSLFVLFYKDEQIIVDKHGKQFLCRFFYLYKKSYFYRLCSLKHASYIMIGAWSFSIFLASLPLLGISDYRKG